MPGHRELADVMEQCARRAEASRSSLSSPSSLASSDRVNLHALQMVVGGVILGLDG